MIRLGINIDHVATLRNARGGVHPDPLQAARLAKAGGADIITAHLREDRRHIRDEDMKRLRAENSLPLNMEMAVTEEMQTIALSLLPHAVCLVPERRQELTTEGGLDAAGGGSALFSCVQKLQDKGIQVALFIDPDIKQVEAAYKCKAQAVEFHTGSYAHAKMEARSHEIKRIQEAATAAQNFGIEVHAGHGLTFENVAPIAAIPEIVELNIGHFLIGEAVFTGLQQVVREMKKRMNDARKGKAA
jgi:pyridoxine 5-phosphate synthase